MLLANHTMKSASKGSLGKLKWFKIRLKSIKIRQLRIKKFILIHPLKGPFRRNVSLCLKTRVAAYKERLKKKNAVENTFMHLNFEIHLSWPVVLKTWCVKNMVLCVTHSKDASATVMHVYLAMEKYRIGMEKRPLRIPTTWIHD